MEPFPGTLQRSDVSRLCVTKTGKTCCWTFKNQVVLTSEQKKWFRRCFPEVENKRLMEAMGITESTLHRLARKMKLTKSEKGLKGIKKRQAAHIKRTCERNGYYDSLRGKPISDACMEGFKKYIEDVKSKRRLHPLKVMKEQNPRKYKKLMRKRSTERTELIRKEKFRQDFGLPRQTRLRIILTPYKRSQVRRRYNALQRGYIVMSDTSEQGGERYNIYYDDDTVRSDKFENNLRKDGFSVKPFTN